MADFLLAHDLGTGSNKATLFNADGLLLHSITDEYDTDYSHGNWAEQNPLDWISAVCTSTRKILEGYDAADVKAVSFSGQMMGCVCVDKDGRPIRNAIIWADQRAVPQADSVLKSVSLEEGYRITGHRISPSYTLAKLLWIKEHQPDLYRETYKVLNAKDFILHFLTGSWVTDHSDASGTNMMDLNALSWSETIVDAAGVDYDKLPDLVPSTEVVGTVTRKAAEATGLNEGTPVVCGAGDGMCAAVGAGCVREGQVYSYLGSSAWIAMTTCEPIVDPEMRTFNWAHAVPGMISPCGTMQAAGSSFRWLRETICRYEEEAGGAAHRDVYEIINERASQSPPGARGVIYLPYLIGERSPWWNPEAKGAFIGLNIDTHREDILRSVIEGVFFNMSLILDVFRPFIQTDTLDVIGGLAKGEIHQRVMADMYGMNIAVPALLDEATSMGAAVIGGVGVGLVDGFDAVDRFIEHANVIKPVRETHAFYAKRQGIFKNCYRYLQSTFADMAD